MQSTRSTPGLPSLASSLGDRAEVQKLLVGGAVAFGLVLRARHLLLGRSLWLDEAFLATALVQRSLGTLLSLPLPYEQTPPPLFLILAKLLSDAAGFSEIVLRAVPFVCGCLGLCLFPLFARRHSRGCALLGTLLLALSVGAAYYSAELKPYSVESMLTVVFLLAGIGFLEGSPSRAGALGLALVFLAGPWLGFTSIFLLAGLAGGLLAAVAVRGPKPPVAAWVILGAGLASFAAMYLLYAGPASATQLRTVYWKEFYVPARISLDALAWHAERASQVMAHFFGLQSVLGGAFLAGLAVLGAARILLRDPAYGLMLTLPLALAALASLLERFPLHERLLVFTLPICCLLAGEGVAAVSGLPGRLGRAAAIACCAALLVLLARPTAGMLFDPGIFERQEFKQLCAEVLRRRTDGDAVFVFQTAIPVFDYYRRLDPRLADFKPMPIRRGDTASLSDAVRMAREAGQGWVLFVHRLGPEERSFTEAFEAQGAVRERVAVKGAWAFAFCSPGPGDPGAAPLPGRPNGRRP